LEDVPSSNLKTHHDVKPDTLLKWGFIFLSPKYYMNFY